jgi:hypothetical protein
MHWGIFTSSLLGKIVGAFLLAILATFGFGPSELVDWIVSDLPVSPATARLLIALAAAVALQLFLWPHLRAFIDQRTGGKGLWSSLLISGSIFMLFAGIMLVINDYDKKPVPGFAGEWRGNKFIYDAPQLVSTFTVGPEDDEKKFRFKVSDAAPEAFVQFKIEYDGGIAVAAIIPHENQQVTWRSLSRKTQYGVRLNDNRSTVLAVHVPPNSDLSIIRLYVLWWEKPNG